MCAINGITKRDRALVKRMNLVTAHRGPDGTGIYEDSRITIGHNRLAIIDVSERGAQPMHSADGTLVISYNGELYNFRELRRELSDYNFISETDTEVILAAYQKWGVSCLKRFNGIFALALWDKEKSSLMLARDQAGVKPLYYSLNDGTLIFSSEIKAVLETGIPRKLDVESFSRYMRLGDVPGPSTMFSLIQSLPPAHYGIFRDGEFTLTEYWRRDIDHTICKSVKEWEKEIQETLDNAVSRQLVSDRPVGVFLSGGIDSSSVLSSVIRAQGTAHTYTTRFEESSEHDARFNCDAELAKQTADFFGTEHTEVVVRKQDVIPFLEASVWHMDGPAVSATAISQVAITQAAARDVVVVLGGDGGDELFGGYKHHRLSHIMDLYQKFPGFVRKIADSHSTLAKFETPPGTARLMRFHSMKEDMINRILAPEFSADFLTSYFTEQFANKLSKSSTDMLMEADRILLADGSLLRMDKIAMAAGLEGRVPMLDQAMLELSAKIPLHHKVDIWRTKKILKTAMKERLPSYLFKQKKRGWFAPSGVWLLEPQVYRFAQEVLSPSFYKPTSCLFDWKGISMLLDEHYNRRVTHRIPLWMLISFQLWAHRFKVTL